VSNVSLEIIRTDAESVTFNIVFLDTGEIRQKRRSMQWLLDRVFYHEIRTTKEAYQVDGGFFSDYTRKEP
jgi:hypothetical protein